jgi:hypothetical protein
MGKLGVNVHDPKYGSWWGRTPHRRNWSLINREWERFLGASPTFSAAVQLARSQGARFGFVVGF